MKYNNLTLGQIEAIVNKLGGMEGVQRLLRGELVVTESTGNQRVIDCDAAPWCPNGWTVEEHRKGGQIEFDPSKVEFYLDDAQKKNTIVGNKLRRRLEGKSVLNANFLDYLLANTALIPESWKHDEQGSIRYIFFWGTIYRDAVGLPRVRYLYWRGDGQWYWSNRWLGGVFGGQYPVALSAS